MLKNSLKFTTAAFECANCNLSCSYWLTLKQCGTFVRDFTKMFQQEREQELVTKRDIDIYSIRDRDIF